MVFLYGFIALSILVFVHELGHFLLAKAFHIQVEEFGIGYPPRFFGFVKSKGKRKFFFGKNVPPPDKGQTIYSFNWIPFGGFNKLKGEFGRSKEKDSFSNQVWWKKMIVTFGGVFGNIVLAILVFTLCFTMGVPQLAEQEAVGAQSPLGIQILGISPSSPAAQAGILPGDIVSQIDGQSFSSVEEMQAYIRQRNNIPLIFAIKRGEEILSLEVTPQPANTIFPDLEDDYGVIGVSLGETILVSYPLYQSFGLAFKHTMALTGAMFSGLWLMFKTLFVQGTMIGDVIGPVGLVSMSGQMAQVGFVYFLQMLGLLSVAIAVCQLIPFPGLDGSRIVLALIEGLRKGRAIPERVEATIMNIGIYLLMILLIFITYKDIANLFF